MKTLSSTVRRVAGPALAAGPAATAFTTPASAAAAPGSTVTRFGGSVALSANPGAANTVTASRSGDLLIMEDLSGIAAGPGCTQLTATTARCGLATSVGQLTISVGDMKDSVTNNAGIPSIINAGSGDDTITGGSRNDTINVQDGAGGDTVTCDGGGFDVVSADRGDKVALDCEVRSGVF
ncbi:hypothetical protein ACIBJF_29385 [Streptomyces sp. NPDC050743]|uniref:hypothetical protein n=1 Tax=Streptomyces sp. NPDC050743 TaxID=3365634 RepID=UPI0037A64EA0